MRVEKIESVGGVHGYEDDRWIARFPDLCLKERGFGSCWLTLAWRVADMQLLLAFFARHHPWFFAPGLYMDPRGRRRREALGDGSTGRCVLGRLEDGQNPWKNAVRGAADVTRSCY